MVNQIEIYIGSDNQTQIEVQFENETAWLTLNQISVLFNRDKSVISRHLKKIFDSNELNFEATVAKNATVQNEAGREVTRDIEYYNLDAIISVGYRVNSKQGTQFRQWATQRLKDYLVKGYAINEQKLQASHEQLNTLKQSIHLLENVLRNTTLNSNEAIGLLKVVTEYAQALELLDQYDHQRLVIPETINEKLHKITYEEAIAQIFVWREKQNAGKLFGNEKDK